MKNIRCFYTSEVRLNKELKKFLDKDKVDAIEIPPEQYVKLKEDKSPLLCDKIKPGLFTYAQATVIAEQHLVEEIKLNRKDITCTHPKGISYVCCYALSLWYGDGKKEALDNAATLTCPKLPDKETCKLNTKKKKMLTSPDDIVRIAGPKAAKILFNIFHAGPRVILRSAFELLRANAITRILSAVVLLAVDTVNLVRRRISKKQFLINAVLAIMMTLGGTVGWMLGTQSTQLVLIENAFLGIIAGLIGAGIFGGTLGMIWEKIISAFIKDDTKDMMEIFNDEFANLSQEYLLSEAEINELTETIEIKQASLKAIFAQSDRKDFARCKLEPYVAGIISQRKKVRID